MCLCVGLSKAGEGLLELRDFVWFGCFSVAVATAVIHVAYVVCLKSSHNTSPIWVLGTLRTFGGAVLHTTCCTGNLSGQ